MTTPTPTPKAQGSRGLTAESLTRLTTLRRCYPAADGWLVGALLSANPGQVDTVLALLEKWIAQRLTDAQPVTPPRNDDTAHLS